jgi:exonuclease I
MHVHTPISPIGIHLMCCAHGNEHTKIHDVVCDIFITIMRNVDFHVRQKQLHMFVLTMSNSFHRQINSVLTKNEILTLTNAIITDPTQINLFF